MSTADVLLEQPPRFNPLDRAFLRDPYPTYARLRREAPHLRTMGALVLTRHADVVAALKDRRFSVDLVRAGAARAAQRFGIEDFSQADRFIRNSLVFTDNPQHARLRRLINQAFAPAMIDRLRSIIGEEVARLLPGAPVSEFDAIAGLAAPLPQRVLCRWIGLPTEATQSVAREIHETRRLLDPGLLSRPHLGLAVASVARLTDDLLDLMASRTGHDPGNAIDVLRSAVTPDGERLEDVEVAFACIMFFVAGTETTQCLIGNLLDAVAARPEVLPWLRVDAANVNAAVEECVRLEAPLQMTKRLATEAFEFNGCTVRAHEQVLLCLGSANRDPEVFDAPDDFRPDRTHLSAHTGFGHGMHACLGGMLARVQAAALLQQLARDFEAPQRLAAQRDWQDHSVILRGLRTLPLRLRKRCT